MPNSIYNCLDHEARLILEAFLIDGIPFHDTKALADHMRATISHVTNLKRRINYHAERIMRRLTGHHEAGGTS